MGIFDELDQAFDFMMSGDDEKADKPQVAAEPDPMLADAMTDLKQAIADEKLQPVLALLAGIDQFRRTYVLAGLHGATGHLRDVETRADRVEVLNQLMGILTTRKNTVRRLLSKSQRQAIDPLADQLRCGNEPPPAPQMTDLMRACVSTKQWQPEDTRALFAGGIWQVNQVLQAEPGMIARITGVDQTKLDSLASALAT